MSNYAFKAKLKGEAVTVRLRGPLINVSSHTGRKILSLNLRNKPEIQVLPGLVQIENLVLEIVDERSPSIQQFLSRVAYLQQVSFLMPSSGQPANQSQKAWFRNNEPLGMSNDEDEANLYEAGNLIPEEDDDESSSTQSLRQKLIEEGWIRGQIAYIRLDSGLIQIRRISLLADLTLGPVRGDKIIPVRNIQAIQYKPATSVVSGALEFVVAGDVSTTRKSGLEGSSDLNAFGQLVKSSFGRRIARATHENTITFRKSQEREFAEFYETVMRAISEWGSPTTRALAPDSVDSVAREIEKLATLFEKGLLSEDEFASAKKRLLEG